MVLSVAFEEITIYLRQKLDMDDATLTNSGPSWGLTVRLGTLLRTSHAWFHLIPWQWPWEIKPPFFRWGNEEVTKPVNKGISIWLRSFWLQSMWNYLFCSIVWASALCLTQLRYSIRHWPESLVVSQAVCYKEITKINPTGWNRLVYVLNLITKDKAVVKYLFS